MNAPASYYVPHESHYPVVLAAALFLLALGFILQINGYPPGPWLMIGGESSVGPRVSPRRL